MKTRMECRSLGENRRAYNSTNSSIRQTRQSEEQVHERSTGRMGGTSTSTGSRYTRSTSAAAGGGAGSVAVSLLAGAGMGVLAGMLMAPQKGQVTRRRVADSASWIGRGITEAFSSGKNKVNSWTSKGRNMHNSPYPNENQRHDGAPRNMDGGGRNQGR